MLRHRALAWRPARGRERRPPSRLRAAGDDVRSRSVPGAALAQHRPVSRRPHQGRRRHSVTAERLLHRRRERRRVEDDRLRPHLEADLRRPADRLDRRDRGRAVRSRTSSTSAAARACSGPTSRPATASTNRPTPARPGRTSACATASRFRRSSSTRANPNRLFVAVLGHPYGPNAERGIFRSTDGGRTFQKVLYKDENTGGDRRRVRSGRSEHRLRRAVGGAAGAVGERRVDRARAAACSNRPTAAPRGGR